MAEHTKKICIIISNIDRWLPFEWVYFSLEEKGYSQSYILLTPNQNTYFCNFLTKHECPVLHIPFAGKWDYPSAFIKLILHLNSYKPLVVHCHFLDATLIGLIASYFARIPSRIYTRHHGFFHHQYFKKGVLLDKLCNRMSTAIIAISSVVKQALVIEGVRENKIRMLHHGFMLEEFSNVDNERIEILIDKYNCRRKRPVIGVIARQIKWKGVQYIIPAIKKLLYDRPDALLVLANARGSFHNEINHLLNQNIPKENYVLIPFEPDIQALYKLFDVYIHVPIDENIEAFGQTYVEALAAGIPSIFTKSGIANEFIENENNAMVVPFKDSEAIYLALSRILMDGALRESLIFKGRKSVEKFAFQNMADQLDNIYLDNIKN